MARARVLGQNKVIEAEVASVCWHCAGTGLCHCINCGRVNNFKVAPGTCVACKGTKRLVFVARGGEGK